MVQSVAYLLGKMLFAVVSAFLCYFTGKAIVLLCKSDIGVESFGRMRDQGKWLLELTYSRGKRRFFHAQTLVLIGAAFWVIVVVALVQLF